MATTKITSFAPEKFLRLKDLTLIKFSLENQTKLLREVSKKYGNYHLYEQQETTFLSDGDVITLSKISRFSKSYPYINAPIGGVIDRGKLSYPDHYWLGASGVVLLDPEVKGILDSLIRVKSEINWCVTNTDLLFVTSTVVFQRVCSYKDGEFRRTNCVALPRVPVNCEEQYLVFEKWVDNFELKSKDWLSERALPQAGIETLATSYGEALEIPGKIKEVLDQVLDQMPSVSSLTDKIERVVDKLGVTIDTLDASAREKLVPLLEDLAENTNLTRIVSGLNKGAVCLLVISGTFFFLLRRDSFSILVFTVTLCIGYYACKDDIWNWIHELFSSNQEFVQMQAQADFDYMTGISTFIFGLVCKDAPTHKIPEKILSHMNNMGRIKEGFRDTFDFVVGLFNLVFSCIGVSDSGVVNHLKTMYIDNEEVSSFIRNIDEIQDLMSKAEFSATRDNYNHIKSLLVKGRKILVAIPTNRHSGVWIRLLEKSLSFLEATKKKFADQNVDFEGSRPHPVSIVLIGPPGGGKTTSVEHFERSLCASTLPRQELEEYENEPWIYIHHRIHENKYWDGMHPKAHVIVFDDFLQSVDVAGVPDAETMNFIRAMGEYQYLVHAADIESKGNLKFNGKFVILTTNMKVFKVESIRSIEAIYRRMNLVYIVVPREEFLRNDTKGRDLMQLKLDYSKLPLGEDGITSLTPESSWYIEYDPSTDTTGKMYSYDEVVEKAVEAHRVNMARYDQKVKELRRQYDKYKSLRADLQAGSERQQAYSDYPYEGSDVSSEIFEESSQLYEFPLPSSPGFSGTIRAKVLNEDDYRYFDEVTSKFGLMEERDHIHFSRKMTEARDYLREHCPVAEGWNYRVLFSSAEFSFGKEFYREIFSNRSAAYLNSLDMRKLVILKPRIAVEHVSLMDQFKRALRDLASRSLTYIGTCIYDVVEKIKENKLVFFFGTLSISTLVYALNLAWSLMKPHMEPQYLKAKVEPNRKFNKIKSMLEMKAQMGLNNDKGSEQTLMKIRRSNMWQLIIPGSEPGKVRKLGTVLFVTGTIVLIPFHYLSIMSGYVDVDESYINKEFVLRRIKEDGTFIDKKLFCSDFFHEICQNENMEKGDLALVKLPLNRVDLCSDIIHNFVTRSYMENKHQGPWILSGPVNTDVSFGMACEFLDRHLVGASSSSYWAYNVICYTAPTDFGDCGSIFSFSDSSEQVMKISGIHIAGIKALNKAICSVIHREDIDETLKMFSPGYKKDGTFEALPQCGNVVDERFYCLKYSKYAVTPYCKNAKVKSPLYGRFYPVTQSLSRTKPFEKEGVLIDPYKIALSKYCLNSNIIPDDRIDKAVFYYYHKLMRNSTKPFSKNLLTFNEALLGLPGVSFSAIPRNTSPGYPYTFEVPKGRYAKSYWFGDDVDYTLDTQGVVLLRARVDEILLLASNGIRTLHVSIDKLKDETRDIAKNEAGKTRLFCCLNLALYVSCRMYFGPFFIWLILNRIDNGSAIGINEKSAEWTYLFKRMSRFSKGWDGDFSNFDGRKSVSVLWAVLLLINRWFDDGPRNARIRTVLWFEVIQSYHLVGETIYEWLASLASGLFGTTQINTLENELLHVLVLMAIFPSPDFMLNYDQYIQQESNGDDNITSASDLIIEKYNMRTVSEGMAALGYLYTAGDKSSELYEFKPVIELRFLKRGFRFNELYGGYDGPIELSTIFTALDYVKSGHYGVENLRNTVEEMTLELALHGREIFNQYANKIVSTHYELTGNYAGIDDYFIAQSVLKERNDEGFYCGF